VKGRINHGHLLLDDGSRSVFNSWHICDLGGALACDKEKRGGGEGGRGGEEGEKGTRRKWSDLCLGSSPKPVD